MDRYDERLIKAKPGIGEILAFVGAILLTLLGLLSALFVTTFGILVLAGGIYLIVITKDGFKVEYEFILTNGDIEVAKILGMKRRKSIGMIEADSIAIMDYADSDYVKNDISLGKVKVKKFVGNENPNGTVAIYVGDTEKKDLCILDLDEKCIEHMKAVLKTKSKIK